MKPYLFEGVSPDLMLMSHAARRAADAAGLKPTLASWQSLPSDTRQALHEAGQEPRVDAGRVSALFGRAVPPPEPVEPVLDPSPEDVPSELSVALGPERPLSPSVWTALSPLDRYVLMKVARTRNGERLPAAYDEIVGQSATVPHLDAAGAARMVGVSDKRATRRRAVAFSRVSMNAEAFARLVRADAPKGDVLGTARLAGILGAKRTADLIPLCHPLSLTRVDVRLELDARSQSVAIEAAVEAFDRTGVEMEALTAASTAALTVYDMLKAFDRAMQIGPTALAEKSGGRSGDYVRAPAGRAEAAPGARFALCEGPLSVDEAVALVARPDSGGTVVFIGTVRDRNAGQNVTLLEYQAYASMALKELARVAEEIERELAGVQLAALHRTGSLAVGEIAVVCAASAPHRDEAFRGARLLIDRLKERVPIWKREHGAEGPYWVGWQDARVTP